MKRRRGLPNSNPPRLASLWRSLHLLVGAMLLSLVFMPASQPQTQARSVGQAKDPSAGHQKMIALLKEIAARTADENPWLGDRAVRILGSRYRALPKDASDVEKWRLGIELANEELRVGNERQAIERFSRACEALPRLEERLTATGVVYPTYRLGVAYLRLGETQNCSLMNIPEACILPIRGGGIHTLQEGSKRGGPTLHHGAEANSQGFVVPFESQVAAEHRLHDPRPLSRRCARALSDSSPSLRVRRALSTI